MVDETTRYSVPHQTIAASLLRAGVRWPGDEQFLTHLADKPDPLSRRELRGLRVMLTRYGRGDRA